MKKVLIILVLVLCLSMPLASASFVSEFTGLFTGKITSRAFLLDSLFRTSQTTTFTSTKTLEPKDDLKTAVPPASTIEQKSLSSVQNVQTESKLDSSKDLALLPNMQIKSKEDKVGNKVTEKIIDGMTLDVAGKKYLVKKDLQNNRVRLILKTEENIGNGKIFSGSAQIEKTSIQSSTISKLFGGIFR